jgi:hypothetical protein
MKNDLNPININMMKFKFKNILVLCFLVVGFTQLNSQNLNVIKKDGTTLSVQLSSLKKITFSSTDMVFSYAAGNADNLGLALISKLTFNSFTDVKNTLAESPMAVYPNPATNYILLKDIPCDATDIIIYSISGVRVLTFSSQLSKIDISSLKPGIYIIRVQNQMFKFSKI